MKQVTVFNISHPEKQPRDIVIKPNTTTADIFKALNLTGYVLVSLDNPNKPFLIKHRLYPKVNDGDDLCAISALNYYLYFFDETFIQEEDSNLDEKPQHKPSSEGVERADSYIEELVYGTSFPTEEQKREFHKLFEHHLRT
jgi:hypothetical protein